jgi:ABC-type lipoprotein release transport system permease subunit
LAGSAVFVRSFDHLVAHPVEYGVTWDAVMGNSADARELAYARERLRSVPGVVAWSEMNPTSDLTVNGKPVSGMAIRPMRGEVFPVVSEGRAPSKPTEIALGRETMQSLKVRVGDHVQVSLGPSGAQRFSITGRMVLNDGNVTSGSIRATEGAVIPWSALKVLDPVNERDPKNASTPQVLMVRVARGVEGERALAALDRKFPTTTVRQFVTPDLTSVDSERWLPIALALVVALLAVAACTHALVSTLRRRGGEFALMRAIGLERRGSSATVLWQSCTFAVVALLVGVPLGVWGGNAAWRVAADQLGVQASPVAPIAALFLLGVATIAVAFVVAVPVAIAARRLRVAATLRSE